MNWKGRIIKRGVALFIVGSDTIKTTLFGRLKHEESKLHFGLAADEEYYRQLTAEKQSLRYVKGFPIREWVKKASERNEALDCAVYAYAALQLCYRRYNRVTMWDQLSKQGKPAPLRSKQEAPAFTNNW